MLATTELSKGDVIDIIQFDEDCHQKLRRIKVKTIETSDSYHYIVGVNMHDKYPHSYRLPVLSATSIVKGRNTIQWTPLSGGEADE